MRRNDWVMLVILQLLLLAGDLAGMRPEALLAGACTFMFIHLCDRKPAE